MGTDNYPGRELSLSQLIFALNNELKRAAYSPSYSLDTISQLDRDTSNALSTIREWRNSLVYINRIPLDVLSLIPTHLSSQKDRFYASFVCRHWRRTFLRYGPLWSQLSFKNGEAYVKAILERANGSALDMIIDEDVPINGMMDLLSPHARQIRSLKFTQRAWADVTKFSAIASGSLPLLHTLEITGPLDQPEPMTHSPYLIFGDCVHVENFVLKSNGSKSLNFFILPRLTTFELWAVGATNECNESDLFDFLKASPMLRTVKISIIGTSLLGNTPQEPSVVLPNVETFFLHVTDCGSVDNPAVRTSCHISCPSSRDTSIMYTIASGSLPSQPIFPPPALSNAIVRQYTKSPIEEVTFDMIAIVGSPAECFLTFQSSDTSVVRVGFKVYCSALEEVYGVALLHASKSIRAPALLSHIKRLHVRHMVDLLEPEDMADMVEELGELFKSMGPLDELTIEDCDLNVFLAPFLDADLLGFLVEPTTFPPIKELAILHPVMEFNEEECMEAIVELAKSQHAKGIPFERVTVRAEMVPATMAERLMQWVGVVVCREEGVGVLGDLYM